MRPGNAGSNTAQDHIAVLAMALLALPKAFRAGPILVRADTVGATHAFVDDIVARKLMFSIGFPLEPDVQAAILAIPAPTGGGDDGGWVPATDPHGPSAPRRVGRRAYQPGPCRPGLACGGPGRSAAASGPTRRGAQARLHRPHRPPLPGVHHQPTRPPTQPGWRTATAPTPGWRTATAPRPGGGPHPRRRGHGLRNLPFGDFDANDVWLTLVGIAQTLVCWAQALLLDGDLKVAEPKTLRFRLWHAAARLVHHARRHRLRFDRDWPWAHALAAAFRRLPVPG